MSIPKLLLSRIQNPNTPLDLVLSSLSQLVSNPQYPPQDVLPALIGCYQIEKRRDVSVALLKAVLNTLQRPIHSDTLNFHLTNLLSVKNSANAMLLLSIIDDTNLSSDLRIFCISLLSKYTDSDLRPKYILKIELTLSQRLEDVSDKRDVLRRIVSTFSWNRSTRPRIKSSESFRDDDTTVV